jgi:phosphoserine aminotransferase
LFNLLKVPGVEGKPVVDYIITGNWSKKASDEAKLFTDFCDINIVCDGKSSNFTTIPEPSTWKISPKSAFIHYCTNETIHGVTFNTLPTFPEGSTVVCDMSSDFLSRPFDVSKFGVIYAGAQKNAGPAGATIVIIRKDLLDRSLPFCPSAISFKKQADKESMLNTPATYAVYVCGLLFDYVLSKGGLEAVHAENQAKAKLLYETMKGSGGFYEPLVKDERYQSIMTVPVRCIAGGEQDKDKMTPHELKFVAEASKLGLVNLKGYRDLGGIRVSMYNAMTLDGLKMLTQFMVEFQKTNPPLK